MKRKTLSLTLALCLVFSLFTWCGLTSTAEDIIPPDNNEVVQPTEPDEDAIPYSSEVNEWCCAFFESLSNGSTIINACL